MVVAQVYPWSIAINWRIWRKSLSWLLRLVNDHLRMLHSNRGLGLLINCASGLKDMPPGSGSVLLGRTPLMGCNKPL